MAVPFFWVEDDEENLEFSFCGIFKSRVGVFVISCQGISLMLITTLLNMYSENTEGVLVQAMQYCLLALYLLVMYLGFILAFVAAFWEKSAYVKIGAYLVSFGMIIYFIFAIVSLVPTYKTMRAVCPGRRCPDHHWLYPDRWRRIVIPFDKELYYPMPHRPPPPHHYSLTIIDSIVQKLHDSEMNNTKNWNHTANLPRYNFSLTVSPLREIRITSALNKNSSKIKDRSLQGYHPLEERVDPKGKDETTGSMLYIIVSVLYILIYIGYLMYTILTFLAFAKELESN